MNRRWIGWSAAGMTALMGAGSVLGQAYVERGRALDGNPLKGSGGRNEPGRAYDFGASNRIVTGNVTGGRSFTAFSPIRDTSSLLLSRPSSDLFGGPGFGLPSGALSTSGGGSFLPSDRLSGFRRDSVGVADVRAGLSSRVARPFYSAGAVTDTGGIISGFNRPGSSQVRSPYQVPRPTFRTGVSNERPTDSTFSGDPRVAPPALLNRTDGGEGVAGPAEERLLNSALFGNGRPGAGTVADGAATGGEASSRTWVVPLDQRVNTEPVETRVEPVVGSGPMIGGGAGNGEVGSPLDPLRTGAGREDLRLTNRLDNRAWNPDVSPGSFPEADTGDLFRRMQSASTPFLRPLRPDPTEADPASEGPERSSGGLLLRTGGRLFRPLDQVIRGRDGASTPAAQPPPQEGDPTYAEVSATEPLRTFVGTEASVINKHLAEAEKLMKAGDYYEAARRYELARVVDASNPLPRLGRSMALLGAGDYQASGVDLLFAIEQFEGLYKFGVDLSAFIPDKAALDSRRADLERRLEKNDDFRLRFLLGYAEYYSGLTTQGLANLTRGAEGAPPEFGAVRRFVEGLRQRSRRDAGQIEPIDIGAGGNGGAGGSGN